MSESNWAELDGDSVSWSGRVLEAFSLELGFSRRESQVGEFLALGHSEKQIAYTLDLSPSCVSRCIRSAASKLGVGSRAEVAALFASFAAGITPRRRRVAGESLAMAAERWESTAHLSALSPAEREVASLVTRGRSDAEIAAARGKSRRTVENQLAAIYRKLGVHSRTELAATLSA